MLNKKLKELYKCGVITRQAFKTYVGQVKCGNAYGCLVGMMRKRLITQNEFDNLMKEA